MCFGDVHYSYTDRNVSRYRRRKQIKRFEEEKEMEGLLNLATEQLFQLKEVAPEVMNTLIQFYAYQIGVVGFWLWFVLIFSAAAVVGGLVWNFFDNWNWEVGPTMFIILGSCLVVIMAALLIDHYVSIKMFEVAPEMYVLKSLMGNN